MQEANNLLPEGAQMLIYKNNSDLKWNSYGCHENYLMDRRTSFKQIVEHLMPFFVTRQVFTGAGKVGSENRGSSCAYQLSQRADFFETEVALDTMVKRPIINTRDEPHADREKYRRLHVIVGDSKQMPPTSFFSSSGTSSDDDQPDPDTAVDMESMLGAGGMASMFAGGGRGGGSGARAEGGRPAGERRSWRSAAFVTRKTPRRFVL